MLLNRINGDTSNVLFVFLQDSSSNTGAGLAGLVHNTSNLTCYYKRSSGTAAVAVSLANITTLGTYVEGGFKQVDATNQPGLYEFHPPDAAMTTGADSVVFFFRGATNLADTPVLVDLKPAADVRLVAGTANGASGLSGMGFDYVTSNYVNVNVLSTTADAAAEIAAAWGASVVGNGRTRDYFLQGGCNKVTFGADGLSFTVYSTDDATVLYTGVSTRLAGTVGGLRSVDPA